MHESCSLSPAAVETHIVTVQYWVAENTIHFMILFSIETLMFSPFSFSFLKRDARIHISPWPLIFLLRQPISWSTKTVNVLNTLIKLQKLCNHITSPFILEIITILKKQFDQFQ